MEINVAAIIVALVAGTLLHPLLMSITRGMLMKHEGSFGLYFNVTLMLAGITVLSVLLVFMGLVLTSRRSYQLLILGPIFWFIGVRAIAAHFLEREEVDETMIMLHYAFLHGGLYYAISSYMEL